MREASAESSVKIPTLGVELAAALVREHAVYDIYIFDLPKMLGNASGHRLSAAVD